VVGGGPAGLSAALVLGRARRRVLVLDTGRPANMKSGAIGGLLGQSGVAPVDLRRAGREQLADLPTVEVRDAAVIDADLGSELRVRLSDRSELRTHGLVLAHGLSYEPPALPGIEPLWGRSVFHCPFCDGWEVRDRALAVHGNGPDVVRSALVVSGWSSDVVLLTDGPAELGDGGRAMLAAAGVRLREEPIRRLVGHEGRLDRIEFASGPVEERDALFVRTRREQPNGLAAALGCELTPGGTIVTDDDGRATVAGVYAAGDAATERLRSVAAAIGSGSRTALAVALDRMPVAAAA
jgi:thioredoxin reductase